MHALKIQCIITSLFVTSMQATIPWFILTGGPCVGKTTTINLLKDDGYQTVPEAYTAVFNQAKKDGNLEIFNNAVNLRYYITAQQKNAEAAIDKNQIAFLDRSMKELTMYSDLYDIQLPEDLASVPQEHNYNPVVFLLDALPAALFQESEVRATANIHNPEQARREHKFLKKAYQNLGFTIVKVPIDTPEKRKQFILDYIKNFLTID